ncbi:3'-5' exonuclease [Syntrophothermus sp.]|uniref:3'-5' exonuclease n=1 Tax=Syntrophothermus sp. TaxID=2736299 RepID=UPI00338D7503
MPGEINSRGFQQWLRDEYRDGLKEVNLTANRRQTSRLEIFSARARSLLETEEPLKVREFVESINVFPVERDYNKILPHGSTSEKVAILCRNNGEVLKISGDLRKRRIIHNVRRQHSRWLLPIWVADLLNGQRRILTRDELAGLNLSGQGETGAPDRLFGLLQTLAGTDGPIVDMEKVRRILTTEARLPDELYERPLSSLTVSTIHQAKGREFDRVYLLEPLDPDRNEDLMEEARVYYVAVTRARSDFRRLERPKTYTWLTKCESNRWREEGKYVNGKTRLVSMEIGLEMDIDEESFVDCCLPGFKPHERQRYIREEVKEGDFLVIALVEDETEYYGIYHGDRLIGRMSDRFTSGVREVMKSTYERIRYLQSDFKIYLPRCFSEVYVEQIYSVVRKPETVSPSVAEPYMSKGVWYAVSVAGMGKVHFD